MNINYSAFNSWVATWQEPSTRDGLRNRLKSRNIIDKN